MWVANVRREHGISSATLYAWRARHGGMNVSQARELEVPEEENARRGRLLADAMLDNAVAKGGGGEKLAKRSRCGCIAKRTCGRDAFRADASQCATVRSRHRPRSCDGRRNGRWNGTPSPWASRPRTRSSRALTAACGMNVLTRRCSSRSPRPAWCSGPGAATTTRDDRIAASAREGAYLRAPRRRHDSASRAEAARPASVPAAYPFEAATCQKRCLTRERSQ